MFMERGTTPIDRELNKKVVKVIHSLLMMEESAPFRKPVAHKALGLEDYKLIVKKPTDLNLIRRQNNEGKYKFVEQILDQIQLCWDNCKLYNAIGSEIYNQALFMEENFDKCGVDILPDFWSGINRQEYNQRFNQKKILEDKKKPDIKNSQHKNEISSAQKEQLLKLKNKKKVSFHGKSVESEQYPRSEPPEHVSADKQKEEHQGGEHIDSHHPSVAQIEKNEMEPEEEEHQEVHVQPILVSLFQSPSNAQLQELSEQVKALSGVDDFAMLQKVLEVLHTNEKQHMKISKNGQMSFEMSKIHISTYHRIKKLLGLPEDNTMVIE